MAASVRASQHKKEGLPTKSNSPNSASSGILRLMTTAVTDGIGNLAPNFGGENIYIMLYKFWDRKFKTVLNFPSQNLYFALNVFASRNVFT